MLAALAGAASAQDGTALSRRLVELRPLVAASDPLAALVASEELAQLLDAIRPRTAEEAELAFAYVEGAVVLSGIPSAHWTHPLPRIELLEDAHSVAKRLGDHELRANVARQLATCLRDSGRRGEARAILDETLEACTRARGMRPFLLLSLADLALHEGDLAEAGRALDEAEDGLLDGDGGFAPHRTARCTLHGLRGWLELYRGLPDRAAPHLTRERELARELGDPRLVAAALVRFADLCLATRRFRTLETQIESALRSGTLEGLPDTRSLLLLQLGKAASTRARREPESGSELRAKARDAFERALASPLHDIAVEARVWLAELALGEGRPEEAAHWLAEPAGSDEPETLALAAALRAELAVARGDSEERLRGAFAELQSAVERFRETWRASPRRRGGSAFLHYTGRRRMLNELFRLSMHLDPGERGVLRAFDELMAVQALGTTARESGYRYAGLAELRRALAEPDGGYLAYVPGPERSYVFTLDADLVLCTEIASSFDLRVAREDAAARGVTALGPLADLLLPQSVRERMSGWTSCTIVGIDLLGYVPFENLPVGSETLGERWSVSYLPSFPVGELLASRPVGSRWDVVLVAAPPIAPSVAERLPRMGSFDLDPAEARALLDAYPDDRKRFHTGEGATRENLARASDAAVLQLVTHGVYAAERERPAGFVLAPSEETDGVLWCEDVEEMAVPPLVVLAVCGTGRGPRRRGEDGVADLGGAFLRAGARTVILSAGRVEYEPTLALFGLLHAELAKGARPAAALRDARSAFRERRRNEPPLFHVVGLP